MPQGIFKESDGFPAILKTIVALEDYEEVNLSEAQLPSSSQASSDWLSVVQGSKRGRSSQGILYIDFVKEEFKRLLGRSKARSLRKRLRCCDYDRMV